jgi:hypothetical protein
MVKKQYGRLTFRRGNPNTVVMVFDGVSYESHIYTEYEMSKPCEVWPPESWLTRKSGYLGIRDIPVPRVVKDWLLLQSRKERQELYESLLSPGLMELIRKEELLHKSIL